MEYCCHYGRGNHHEAPIIVKKMRASILALGPLLTRCGKADVNCLVAVRLVGVR